MTERADVLVIGAGVIGLTTAVHLAEQGLTVRVRAGEPPRATTSAVAAAVLGGPLLSDPADSAGWEPQETTTEWHRVGLAEFGALAERPGTGVRVTPGRWASRPELPDDSWVARLPGYRPCAPEEHPGFAVAFWLSVPIVDMPVYFDHLTERLAAAGGRVEIGQVASLEEAATEAPVVVNCTGAHAGRLTGDPEIRPNRGQHVIVENPGLDGYFYEFSKGPKQTSFLPHGDRVVCGGTATRDDWSREPDPAQTREIIARCAAVEPRLAQARVLGVEVGLRAARPRVRLEEESLGGARVIHNYGHSGAGVGLSWGCAHEVGRIIQRAGVN
ncbi:amino acid oxidase [Sphaerisporangium melleum]|uniref:D-amino-acid oxidase n=1 Tax=Sphaerisporangium melleum TaxID=321316 RepID=A0A917RF21_9ACTN|nr:FAD-dependent oxidoreductase [Sphaerisporangium melleum]GGL05108.1 amino acid oxidase [Sphaerisporangium melleum]GII73933.1 amino acid oxidase [Sphaerisporangium melleum]